MDQRAVVTVFVRDRGEVLLCRRSDAVGSYPGRWGGVAGHVADDDGRERTPEAAARAELREEVGLDDGAVTLVQAGDPFSVADDDRGTRWRVHPFLFETTAEREDPRAVEPNWEIDDWAWVAPTAILDRPTVPALWTSYDRVRPRVATVREDRDHGSAWLSVRALELLRDEAALAARGREASSDESREADGDDWAALATLAGDLLAARPSMAVVTNRVDRAMATASEERTPAALESATEDGIERAVTADAEAGVTAAQRLPGRVATLSRSGTVERALRGREPPAVLVAESRPGGEGIGVAERLAATLEGANVTVTTDAAFPAELAAWDAEALVVGADRVLPDGRVVNKVGTHGAALAAREAGVDVVVVAASDKVATDDAVDREPRPAKELYDGGASLGAANPTFDVTPADAVDAIVTERGGLTADEVGTVAAEHRRLAAWRE